MNKKYAKVQSTRRSLIMSILSLMLCVAMLLGTTYAWFTDSVTSGKNTIKAGNLDVELTHTNASVTNQKVQDATDLFGVALWEPGVIAYENFTVKNVGTLALKYSMMVTPWAYNKLGEHDLTEVIKVAVVEGGYTPDATNPRAQAQAISGYQTITDRPSVSNQDVPLGVGEEKTFGMVLYWEPTDHDNDYNVNNGQQVNELHDGKNELFIEFGINLVATQDTVEVDSFDELYDEQALNPILTEFIHDKATVSVSKSELDDTSSVSSVKLTTNSDFDITATIDKSVAKEELNKIMASEEQGSAEDTRLDLNLNVVTTDKAENTVTYDISMDGTVTTIKDGVKTVRSGKIESVSGYVEATMDIGKNLTNVLMTHSGHKMTKIADINSLPEQTDANYNEYGFYSYDYTTGLLNIATKTFSPFTVSFEIPDQIKIGDGESLDLTSKFADDVTFAVVDTNIAVVSGKTLTAKDPGETMLKATIDNKVVECLLTVTPFHCDIKYVSDPFVLANEDQLENFYDYFMYNGTVYPVWESWGDYDVITKVELAGDIDMSKVTVPDSISIYDFSFDGKGYTISNGTKPLFNCAWFYGDVTLKDLTLKNFTTYFGLFSKYGEYSGNITFDNVDIIDCEAKGGCAYVPYAYYAGDIVTIKNCDITNCNINDENGAQGFVGAFVGNSKAGVTVDNCTVVDSVISLNSFSGAGLVGSEAGTIKNCFVNETTTVVQKGSSSVCALGAATRTDSYFFGAIESAKESQAKLQNTDGIWKSRTPVAAAEDFEILDNGSIVYNGENTLSKVIINQKYTSNNLKNGEYDPNSCGYPTYIEDGNGREFTNITKSATITDAIRKVTNVRHVGATHTEKLNYNLDKLPEGLAYNTREVAFKDGTLYIDSSSKSSYEQYISGGEVNQTGKLTMTVYIYIYDGEGNLMTTVTKGYTFQPTAVQ